MNMAMFIPWITKNRGGTEHVGAMIANLCAEQGHSVFIHTFDNAKGSPTYPLHESIEVRIHLERPMPVDEMQILMELTAQRPDLLVGLHMNRGFYPYVYYASKLGVPLLLSEHDNPTWSRQNGSFFKEEREAIFARADRLHFLSDIYRKTLPPALQDRARVIANTASRPDLPAEPEQETAPKTVLYVGRLAPVKRVAKLLEAFHMAGRNASDWRLQIAGDGQEEQALRALAEKLGLLNKVIFMGRVEDTYALYREASIFVSPSACEAQTLTVIEAMAHGLPVVACTDCEGMDMVRDKVTGILADPDAGLAAALIKLMRDPSLRGEMGRAGREVYEKKYSPEVFQKKWLEVLEETAAISESVACRQMPASSWPETALQQSLDLGASPENFGKIIRAGGESK